ncbi:unnamed protein product [Paramecium octaurelia]|uniref:Peptidase M14 domain-containing protein n=1 Tax=Paramecium octaurelia TaxID=43137 RepID=A0A8S1WBT0_PAROT|nr:unnamed protein product [Paramecium octaurelia]
MKKLILFTLIFAIAHSLGFPSFYHRSSDIHVEIAQTLQKCDGVELEMVRDYPKLSMVTLNKNQNKPNKGFVLFGEHARELISPETGLHFVKKLCSENEEMKSIKDNYELRMIVNLNPLSREKVESGDFCKRENENGVDLNRNYKSHWSKEHDPEMVRTAPGPFAFSEAETQTVRDELKKFSPDVFFSIHSGTLALFTPYAYSKEQPSENLSNMMQILTEVREKHCETCKMGSCGHEIGYLSPGTSMDYAYDDLKANYFQFIIFRSPIHSHSKSITEAQMLELKSMPSNFQKSNPLITNIESLKKINQTNYQEIIPVLPPLPQMPPDECFKYFNPEEKEQYDYYVENWAQAITLSLNRVAEQRQTQQQS